MTSLDDPRRHVRYHAEYVSNVSSTDFPGHNPEEQHLWSPEQFKKKLVVKIQRMSQITVEFDLVGVDASIANAFRRILIAEVPTMAIETVYLFNNTSVVHDEILGQRIGLVPLAVDSHMFTMPDPVAGPNDRNTLVFNLNVKCERNKNAVKGETDPEKLYIHSNVYSRDLIFKPEGEQVTRLAKKPPRPANGDILLAKLRPGQEIEATLHACKGTGDMHAKWSPVATASYRLLPHIIIREPIPPQHARKFQACFAPGVIDVRRNPRTGEDEVVVAHPRKETMSREVLRHEEFKDKVELTRIRDYFLFSIESTGCIPPEKLFLDSVAVLRAKIRRIKSDIQRHLIDDVVMEGL